MDFFDEKEEFTQPTRRQVVQPMRTVQPTHAMRPAVSFDISREKLFIRSVDIIIILLLLIAIKIIMDLRHDLHMYSRMENIFSHHTDKREWR